MFDPDEAVATAQRLFHSRGYDAVSIAHLTQAIGINPPSFYVAFGSKAELYSRILDRYAGTGAIPLLDLLNADRPVAECLVAVLEVAAQYYAADPDAAGCLVFEGVRCTDPEAREAAGTFLAAAERAIHRFVAARHPDQAERVTDYMNTVMAGLSASARNGHNFDRLLATARLAGVGLEQTFALNRQGRKK